MDTIDAKVKKIYPVEEIKSKSSWEVFKKRKVEVEFDLDKKFPNSLIFDQFGDKKMPLVDALNEWDSYRFHVWFKANNWFNSISFWKADPIEWLASAPVEEPLPF